MPIRIAEVMGRTAVAVRPGARCAEIVAAMDRYSVRAVAVVDEEDRPVGVVSEGDLRRGRGGSLRAEDLMSSPAVTVTSDVTAGEVARLMDRHAIRQVPVVDPASGKIAGMVWQPDVVSLVEPGDGREALEAVVEAATWAPSIHNTQPWSFAVAGEEISLRADMDRRLPFSDPQGRQLLISCGAALFNMKTAIRAMDRAPIVRTLPDPDRPSLLATVRIGPPEPAGEEVRTIRHEIPRRRTHRGGFTDRPLPEGVLGTLVTEAAQEGGRLIPLTSETSVEMLAALTSVAQEAHAGDPDFDLEMIRWGRRPGSGRRDGVPADAYLRPGREPPRFPQRDYSRGQGWGGDAGEAAGAEVGVVALLTTPGDDRIDWLHAGQALQRVLLHAAVHGIGAAFHTQSLEYPNLRDFVRTELCSKEFPQVLIRLGYPDGTTRGVRRPLSEVLSEEHGR